MENMVIVFCGVRYENKEDAKKLGAKWNSEKKSWYFQFNINEVQNNENIHTYSFKPFSLLFMNCDKSCYTSKTYSLLFNLLNERNQKYILDNPKKPEDCANDENSLNTT